MPVFLKYGQIKGDAKEPAHRGWIELTSAQFGQTRSISSRDRERPAGSPTITEIVVTKKNDGASVALHREAISGKAVDAVIDFVGEDGTVNFRLTMSGTLIASFNLSSGSGGPSESLTLNFTSIEFTPTPGTPPP